jgi:DNA-binding NarL/FixJ family response regulator
MSTGENENRKLTLVEIIPWHPLTATAIESVFSRDSDDQFAFCAQGDSADSTLHSALRYVAIIDLSTLSGEIRDVIRSVRVKCPHARFIVLVKADEVCEKKILSLLYMGVENFVLLTQNWAEELRATLRAALSGEISVPTSVLRTFVHQTPQLLQTRDKTHILTRRENEILSLLLQNCSNKDIANALNISARTVKFHVSHILRKLNVSHRRSLLKSLEATAELLPLPVQVTRMPFRAAS